MKNTSMEEEFTFIAKGICFGSAIGLIVGSIFSEPALLMTLGAVVGVIIAEICRLAMYLRRQNLRNNDYDNS